MGAYQGFSTGGETIGGMYTKPATLPFPFWLYYFNIGDVEAAAKRVEAGGGEIVYGPTAVPGGAWIVHCMDPQGAIFALLDKRSRKVGYVYFERGRAPRLRRYAEPPVVSQFENSDFDPKRKFSVSRRRFAWREERAFPSMVGTRQFDPERALRN